MSICVTRIKVWTQLDTKLSTKITNILLSPFCHAVTLKFDKGYWTQMKVWRLVEVFILQSLKDLTHTVSDKEPKLDILQSAETRQWSSMNTRQSKIALYAWPVYVRNNHTKFELNEIRTYRDKTRTFIFPHPWYDQSHQTWYV